MNIERSTVTKLSITGAPALDPINVYAEDLEPRKGRITIRCYDTAWTAYWGGMGDQTIAQFFCSCDEHYIAKNLKQGISSDIVDADSIENGALREIIALRRGRFVKSFITPDRLVRTGRNEIDAKEARELWEEVQSAHFGDDGWSEPNLMQKVFGDDWWHRLPTKPNPEYKYLCRIIKAVQDAFKQIEQAEAVPA